MRRFLAKGFGFGVLLAACHGDGSAIGADAGDDASYFGPPRVGVQLPDGWLVFGHDGGGAHVAHGVSGDPALVQAEFAKVALDIPSGGAITAHDPAGTRWVTIAGVEPRDRVEMLPYVEAYGYPTDPVHQVLVTSALPAGATHLEVSGRCSQAMGQPGVVFDLPSALFCDFSDYGTVTVAALDDAGTPQGFLRWSGPGWYGAPLTIGGPWSAPVPFAMAIDGIPAGVATVEIERTVRDQGRPGYQQIVSVPAAAPTASFRFPAAEDDAVYRIAVGERSFMAELWQAGLLDLAPHLLPAIDGVTIGDHAIAWNGGVGDAVLVTVTAGSGAATRTWTVVAPSGVTSLRFPADVDFEWPAAGEPVSVVVTEIAGYWFVNRRTTRLWMLSDPPDHVPHEVIPLIDVRTTSARRTVP